MSSRDQGEPIARTSDARPHVYRRDVHVQYPLRLQAARTVFNEIRERFPVFPFALSQLTSSIGQVGLALTELIGHGLLVPSPVQYEAKDVVVAVSKLTVLVRTSSHIRRHHGHSSFYMSDD